MVRVNQRPKSQIDETNAVCSIGEKTHPQSSHDPIVTHKYAGSEKITVISQKLQNSFTTAWAKRSLREFNCRMSLGNVLKIGSCQQLRQCKNGLMITFKLTRPFW